MKLRTISLSPLALCLVASLGVSFCRHEPTCPEGSSFSAARRACVREGNFGTQTGAPVICSPQICADPTRRSGCTNCR